MNKATWIISWDESRILGGDLVMVEGLRGETGIADNCEELCTWGWRAKTWCQYQQESTRSSEAGHRVMRVIVRWSFFFFFSCLIESKLAWGESSGRTAGQMILLSQGETVRAWSQAMTLTEGTGGQETTASPMLKISDHDFERWWYKPKWGLKELSANYSLIVTGWLTPRNSFSSLGKFLIKLNHLKLITAFSPCPVPPPTPSIYPNLDLSNPWSIFL